MNEPAYTSPAKDLPPVVNDDRPDLPKYNGLCCDEMVKKGDRLPMDNAMEQIERAQS